MIKKRMSASGESGAALLLVLIFVFVVGTSLAALLPYTQTGITEAATARQVRTIQNAVDGAMQGAIGQARINTDACVGNNRPVYNAPSYPDPVQPANASAAVNVTVTCAPAPGQNAPANVPPYAIVTTNGPLDVTGNSTLSVDGGIYANGPITAVNGGSQLLVDVIGPVYTTPAPGGGAGYSCDSGLVFSSAFPPSGTPHCPAQSGDPALPDTGAAHYPSSLGSSVPTPMDPLGTCTSTTSMVTFVPGYYSETPQADPVSCKNNTSHNWWFAPCANAATGGSCAAGSPPGTYYLDFPDSAYDNFTNSQAAWNLNSSATNLIGGTLSSDGTTCDPKGVGVQVVLGGATQLATGNNSSIELCASPTAPGSSADGSQQRIALYGIPNDYPSATAGPRSESTNGPTPPANAGSAVLFSPPSGAKHAGDGSVAVASFPNSSSAATAAVTLSNYTAPASGNLVTHAWLEVTHSESSNKMKPSVTVTFPWGGNNYTGTCALSQSASMTTTEIDLMSSSGCNWSPNSFTFASAPLRAQLMQNMTVAYSVSDPKSTPGSASVDGVELKTKTVAPGIEPERPAQGQPASSFCAFDNGASASSTNCASATTSNNDTFFVGTVYTPQAPDYAVVHNSPVTIFRRGVIAQALTVNANASSKQSDSPFELPTSFTNRYVLFTASIGGKAELRALVRFVDYTPPDSSPSDNAQYFPGRAVVVKEWTNLDQ